MDLKEYNHNYYITVYKEKIRNKKVKCEACNCEYSKWNEYKHFKSKKHIVNTMTEEEKQIHIQQKISQMEEKYLTKLKSKYFINFPNPLP